MQGEASTLDDLLAAEPNNVAALLMRGDAYNRAQDRRAAVAFYQAALAAAAQSPHLPPALRAELERAAAFVREAGASYQAHLERGLAERNVRPDEAGKRFREALDILFGHKQVHLQQPSIFYFPGLPQIQFYEREQFEWAADLEAATPAIQAELEALLREGAEFRPYMEQEKDRPFRDFHGMVGDPSWSAFYLWQNGEPVEENAARCPETVAALERVPMTRMGARTPSVLFSLLRPGAHIPSHHGMLNTRLICHLPLIVPAGCWLRVGNETRYWEEGKLLIFDDSIAHEARNPTGRPRIILLFDIWRPELDDAERKAVAAIFEAIDAYGGIPAANA
ncbi:MAG: aspartyl/asparaginyl beta-hydroxylase domain-containing protein [Pseudomonadota bacterium]|nr:aspartyl/asparaginyl beta-hydroxylase domain-containing protein [Pseudomonadota bacterium]